MINQQSFLSNFGGKALGPLPSLPADAAKERHKSKKQRLDKEKIDFKQPASVSLKNDRRVYGHNRFEL